jgi:hypothetical protein
MKRIAGFPSVLFEFRRDLTVGTRGRRWLKASHRNDVPSTHFLLGSLENSQLQGEEKLGTRMEQKTGDLLKASPRLSRQPSLHTSQLGRLDNSHPHRKKSEKLRKRIQKTFEREPRGGGYRDVLHYTRPDWQIG